MSNVSQESIECARKIESVKKLHHPEHYVFVQRTSEYYGSYSEALNVGNIVPSEQQVAFTLCAVCHHGSVEEDEVSGAYFRHSGSYPCETIKLLSE